MPVAAAAVDGHHGERRQAGVDSLRQALLDTARHHRGGVAALPCRAITGRSGWVCPGGRAIAQLVGMPPRAAEMNVPVVIVGAAVGSAAAGKARLTAPSAAAPAPNRNTARRLRLCIWPILPRFAHWSLLREKRDGRSGRTGSIALVTAAVTRKGERRRYALVTAAAELLCEGGFDAVRHRAVADRAGLRWLPPPTTSPRWRSWSSRPSSTSGAVEAAELRERVQALPRRRRGAEASADLLVDLLAEDSTREHTISATSATSRVRETLHCVGLSSGC